MNTILQKRIDSRAVGIGLEFRDAIASSGSKRDVAEAVATLTQTAAHMMAEWMLEHLWISVEEALPEIVDGYRSALVIVRSKYNSYDVAKWDEYYKDWITPDYAVANVTHWMPIPKKGGEE